MRSGRVLLLLSIAGEQAALDRLLPSG